MFVKHLFVLGTIFVATNGQNAAANYFINQYVQSKITDIIGSIDTNNTCVNQVVLVTEALRLKHVWALKMADATSKIASGYAEGNIINLGSYDECINTNEIYNGTVIKGKYCLYAMFFSNLPTEAGKIVQGNKFVKENIMVENGTAIPLIGSICVPNTCDSNNIDNIFNATNILGIRNVSLAFDDKLCQTMDDEDPLTTKDWCAILILGAIFSLIVMSTLYNMFIDQFDSKPKHEILLAFSLHRNFKKLTTIKEHADQIPCINGLRFISMMWIILAHRYLLNAVYPNVNYVYIIQKWAYLETSSIITGATVSVDTFFFISGTLVIYVVMLAKSQGINFNLFHYYIHRYIRLTPAMAAVILMYSTLFRYFGSGPMWPLIEPFYAKACNENWWKSLLYIQNLQKSSTICVQQTWYLAVDTQLYVLAPLIFLPLRRWPTPTLFGMLALTLGSCYSGFLISWNRHANASIFASSESFSSLYSSTVVRMNTWLIGAILGYILFKTRGKKIRIHRALVMLLWVAALTAMGFVVFSMTLLIRAEYNRLISSMYYGFSRALWTLGLSWIVFACVHGYGGLVNKFLSCRVFIILGRLTYTIFLMHIGVSVSMLTSGKTNGYFSDLNVMHAFWGDLAFVIVVATIWSLAFESPIIAIGKFLLPEGMAKKIQQAELNGNIGTRS